MVVFSGIHGNEKAGVLATEKVLARIREENLYFKGNVHFILGNISALNQDVRFKDADLNRIWTPDKINDLQDESFLMDSETREQIQIYALIKEILSREKGPFYFLDLHTTSSPSVPFPRTERFKRSIAFTGPSYWNELPGFLKSINDRVQFVSLLKTYFWNDFLDSVS